MGKVYFTPATGLFLKRTKRERDHLDYGNIERYGFSWKSFDLSWWKPNSLFQHNALLITPCYVPKEEFNPELGKNLRDHLDPEKKLLVISDSGGSEIASRGLDIDPADVLQFQERNADIGMIVDHPPMSFKDGTPNYSRLEFEKCLAKTKGNAEFASRNRTNYDMTLLNVLQGTVVDDFVTWYKEIHEVPLDGYAVSFKPVTDGVALARYLSFLVIEGLNDKPLHVFCGTGRDTMPVVVWASKYFPKVTFDSASYTHMGAYKLFMIPQTQTTVPVRELCTDEDPPQPCWCPVCSRVPFEEYLKDTDMSRKYLALHNLHQYISYFTALKAFRTKHDEFFSLLSATGAQQAIESVETFERCIAQSDIHSGEKKTHSMNNIWGCI